MAIPSEEDMVRAILNREESVLHDVLAQYGNLIKSIISKHMRALQMYQEECFNDVLLAIWEHADRFAPEKSSLKNWIAGITKYKALGYVRKYGRERSQEDIDIVYDLADERATQALLEAEHDAAFEEMIGSLSREDQELFRRLYLEEQDVKQISRDMQLSHAAIYNRLSRGKKKLRSFFGEKGE